MTKPLLCRNWLTRPLLALVTTLSAVFASAQPQITGFTPAAGAPGTTVTITGTGFNPNPGNNYVWFGGIRAVVITATTTTLAVTSPAGATFDRLSVLDATTHLIGYSTASFLPTFTSSATNQTVIDATHNPGINFITRGNFPFQLYTADLDGDGKPDVVANTIATASIWRNTSTLGHLDNTAFAPGILLSIGTTAPKLALADLDGDGKLDLISGPTTSGHYAAIYKNNSTPGNLSFTSISILMKNSGPVDAADIDGDGKLDLLIASADTLSVWFNTTTPGGALSFAGPVTYSLGGNSNDLVVTDVDGDGKPDIVTANNTDKTISILRNTAAPGIIDNSSLASPVLLSLNRLAVTLALRDMDADGKPDIVFTTDSGAAILKNLATPGTITTASFASEVDFPTVGSNFPTLAIGDLDGDSKPDIVIDNVTYGHTGTVSILKNSTAPGIINAGSFATRTDVHDNPSPYGVAIVDIDGDGTAELLITNSGDGLSPDYFSVIHPVINTQPPTLSAIKPDSAAAGATVTITGLNLSGATAVSLGGTPVTTFATLSDTVITATVAGGATGNVSVTTSLGTRSLSGFYFISPIPPPPTLQAPVLSSVSPTHAKQGDAVSIKGLHLDSVYTLTFGGVAAQSFSATGDTVIRAIIGAGATGSIIAINRVGRDTLNGFVFDTIPVTPPDTVQPPPAFQLVEFSGAVVSNKAVLEWKTKHEQHIAWYRVQHAIDTIHWHTIATLPAFGRDSAGYNYTDSSTRTGANFYRLSIIPITGDSTHSNPVALQFPSPSHRLTVYPNPSTTGWVIVDVPVITGPSQFQIVNIFGAVVRNIPVAAGTFQVKLYFTGLMRGVYTIVWRNGHQSAHQTVLIL